MEITNPGLEVGVEILTINVVDVASAGLRFGGGLLGCHRWGVAVVCHDASTASSRG